MAPFTPALTVSAPVSNKSNIRLPDLWFAFDEYSESTVRVRHGQLEYLDPNIQIFVNFIVSNHILNFQPQTDSIGQFRIKLQQAHHHFLSWWKATFSSIDESTSKFIEINGNLFYFYVINRYRRHYDTQINEMTKIAYEIDLPSSVRQIFEYSKTNCKFDLTNLWERMVCQIEHSTSYIRLFMFDQTKMLFTDPHSV